MTASCGTRGNSDLRLDPGQTNAVNHYGNLVIFGIPGTGKTRALVERARRIADSENRSSVVLVASSDSEAERITRDLGPKVMVGTPQDIGRHILDENPKSRIRADTQVIRRQFQVRWCIENIDSLCPDAAYILDTDSPSHTYDRIVDTIAAVKRRPDYPDCLRAGTDGNKPLVEAIHDICSGYEEYLAERNQMDREDMVGLAVRLLRDPANVPEFSYVLVDDFDDMDALERELVILLASGRNITVSYTAGMKREKNDLKGWIRELMGIEPYTNKSFGEQHRSSKKIMQNCKAVRGVMTEWDVPDGPTWRKAISLRHQDCNSDVEQAAHVAYAITGMEGKPFKLVNGGIGRISYGSIAVVTKHEDDCRRIASGLRKLGIPVTLEGKDDMLSCPAVAGTLACLRIAASPQTSGMEVFRLLRDGGVAEKEIADIMKNAYDKRWAILNAFLKGDAGSAGARSDCVLEELRASREGGAGSNAMAVLELIEKVNKTAVPSTPVSELVEYAVEVSGSRYAQDVRSREAMKAFTRFAQEYANAFAGSTLEGLLDCLPAGRMVRVGGTRPETNEVHMLTFAEAQGREFPVIIMTDMSDWRLSYRPGHAPFPVARGLRGMERNTGLQYGDLREIHEAMSRAMCRLNMTSAMVYGKVPQSQERKSSLVFGTEMLFSASGIMTYMVCPLRFKFRDLFYVPGLPDVRKEIGNIVHGVAHDLAAVRKGGGRPTVEIGDRIIERSGLADLCRNGFEERYATRKIKEMVERYVRWENRHPNMPEAMELSIRLEIGGFEFHVRLDRLEKNPNGEYELIDYKSGRQPREVDTSDDLQLAIYTEAIGKKYGRLPARASMLYIGEGYPENRVSGKQSDAVLAGHDVSRGKLDVVLARIEEAARQIANGKYDPLPGPRRCSICDYAAVCDSRYGG